MSEPTPTPQATPTTTTPNIAFKEGGMTLKDAYFIAALTGLLSAPNPAPAPTLVANAWSHAEESLKQRKP